MIGGFPVVACFVAVGDFPTQGVELSAAGEVGQHFNWRANYTFTDTKEHLQPFNVLVLSPHATTARDKANIALDYVTDGWFATTVLRCTSATRQFGGTPEGHITLFDVRQSVAWDQKIGVTLGNASLSLTGENLMGARGASGSPVAADRRATIGIGVKL